MRTGEAFIFDVRSFYGHNEYDIGNWRAPRHKLSNKAYIRNYKQNFPVSEPGQYLHSCGNFCVLLPDGLLQKRIGMLEISSIL
jgi:hypothetical protein